MFGIVFLFVHFFDHIMEVSVYDIIYKRLTLPGFDNAITCQECMLLQGTI